MTATPTDANNCYGPTDIPDGAACTYTDSHYPTPTPAICDKSGYWVPELLYDLDPTNTAITASPESTLVPAYMNI